MFLEIKASLQKHRQEPQHEIQSLERKLWAVCCLLKDKLGLGEQEWAGVPEQSREAESCSKCGRSLARKSGHGHYCGSDDETIAEALKIFASTLRKQIARV